MKKNFLLLFASALLISSCVTKYYAEGGRVHMYQGGLDIGYHYVLPDSDPATHKKIKGWYSKDAHTVYFGGDKLEGADPESFKLLKGNYSHDATHVWWKNELIAGADPVEFHVLKDGYAKTNSHVYRWSFLIENADPQSFQILGDYLSKDKNTLYLHHLPFQIQDLNSFEYVKDQWAKDRYNIYWIQIGRFPVDTALVCTSMGDYDSFKVLSRDVALDKYHVYIHKSVYDRTQDRFIGSITILEDADSKTFKVIDDKKGKDKYREYDIE